MSVRVAINGMGRIGRLTLRAAVESKRNDVEVVAVNNRSGLTAAAHLLKYDSVHGPFQGEVSVNGDRLDVGSGPIRVFEKSAPEDIDWASEGVDVVLECTGKFKDSASCQAHFDAGARKVLISAPGKNVDRTVVYGVNHSELAANDNIVSNASCTTNCLAPIAKVLHETCGIESGYMTTIHAYTSDQRILDNSHKDLRRARAAALSMIPTSTGAARALGDVLPDLAGKLDGIAIRVPTPNVSMVDLVFVPSKPTTVDEVNAAMLVAANGSMNGIISVCDDPLVSTDFNHHSASAIFDATQTAAVEGGLIRVAAWYDNEWGFSCRMNDTAVVMGNLQDA
ncbi:MAG: type I glyceraldehyde-3-phosphate dehydrogenase [Hyphomicrobiales bacterium]